MAEKILIASGKGGVGKTSLTVGLGKALAAMGNKVLLIDCDCLRSIDLLVGVTEKIVYDWGDVIKGADSEDALYDAGDVSVLTCPEDYGDITEKDMKRLLDKYDADFNYILIDAPAGVDRGLTLSAAAADRAIVISTPDLVCVRSACIAARKIVSLGMAYYQPCVPQRCHQRQTSEYRLCNRRGRGTAHRCSARGRKNPLRCYGYGHLQRKSDFL